MKCPFCGSLNARVLDSRSSRDVYTVKRRRECLECASRFNTYETVEDSIIYVLKRDGTREVFSTEKILRGMLVACRRRPVSIECLKSVADVIKGEFYGRAQIEIPSSEIGTAILKYLKNIDEIAYIRFASVYQDFKSVQEFINIVQSIKGITYKKKRKFTLN